MIKFNAFVTCFVLIIVGTAGAQTSSKDDPALMALVRQMATYQVTFDASGLDKILSSDYIEISPAGEFDPREKVLGFYKPDQKPGANAIPALDVSEVSVRNYGKFAILIAKLTYAVSPAVPSRSMRGTFVCRRENGTWKIASAHYTGIRPPQPPKT